MICWHIRSLTSFHVFSICCRALKSLLMQHVTSLTYMWQQCLTGPWFLLTLFPVDWRHYMRHISASGQNLAVARLCAKNRSPNGFNGGFGFVMFTCSGSRFEARTVTKNVCRTSDIVNSVEGLLTVAVPLLFFLLLSSEVAGLLRASMNVVWFRGCFYDQFFVTSFIYWDLVLFQAHVHLSEAAITTDHFSVLSGLFSNTYNSYKSHIGTNFPDWRFFDIL